MMSDESSRPGIGKLERSRTFVMDEKQVDELRTVFEIVARQQHDEDLNASHLGELLQMLGLLVSDEELNSMFGKLGHQKMTFDDFKGLMTEYFGRNDTIEEIKEAFHILKRNRDGENVEMISAETMFQVLKDELSLEECQRIVEILGGEGVKGISWHRFSQHMLASSMNIS